MPLALSSPLPLLLAALLTSGCAGLVSSDAEDGSEESAPPMAREAEVERDIAPSTPDSGLTEEVLYDLPDRGERSIVVDGDFVRDHLGARAGDEDLRRYIL
ncbi:MAG: hypothetical protein ACOCUM_05085 [Thiohalospira sp.]